jgi:hypothetical protein
MKHILKDKRRSALSVGYDFRYDGTLPDTVSQTAIDLNGFKNLTVDGGGSEFVFHGRMSAMNVENNRYDADYSPRKAERTTCEGKICISEKPNKSALQSYPNKL